MEIELSCDLMFWTSHIFIDLMRYVCVCWRQSAKHPGGLCNVLASRRNGRVSCLLMQQVRDGAWLR